MFDTDLWRWISVIASFGILLTLTATLVSRRGETFEYVAARASLILVFVVLAYAGAAALGRGLPPQDYNFYAAVSLTGFWVTLLTPWRWFRKP